MPTSKLVVFILVLSFLPGCESRQPEPKAPVPKPAPGSDKAAPPADSVPSKSKPVEQPLNSASGLDIESKTIVAAVADAKVGSFDFARQDAGSQGRLVGSSGDVPLAIALNIAENSRIDTIELTYFVAPGQEPVVRENVAKVFSAIVLAAAPGTSQDEATRLFQQCMDVEGSKEKKDELSAILKDVEVSYKYSRDGNYHEWSIRRMESK